MGVVWLGEVLDVCGMARWGIEVSVVWLCEVLGGCGGLGEVLGGCGVGG